MADTNQPLYAARDTMALGEHYIRHVNAMTAEGLHRKSAIAAELAHRDAQIAALRAAPTRPVYCWCCKSPNWPAGSGGIEHAGNVLPLTEDQIAAIFYPSGNKDEGALMIARAIARAIEKAHGITGPTQDAGNG